MTRGLVRYQLEDHLHFVTFSCYHRQPYLVSPASKLLFESALEHTRCQHDFLVIGYVVMPEHVHLLMSEPVLGLLGEAFKSFKVSVSKRSIQRPFWQPRYYDFNVYSAKKRIEKLRYIHRNPVNRGLVDKPEEWPWSSFRHYATGEIGIVEIESEWTAQRREALTQLHKSSAGASLYRAAPGSPGAPGSRVRPSGRANLGYL
jgi:putative transposase